MAAHLGNFVIMRPCVTVWGFLTSALWLSIFLAAPDARAEWSADGECRDLRAALRRSFDESQFPGAVTAGSALLSRCTLGPDEWDLVSSQFAAALGEMGRTDEALAVTERCVAHQPRSPHCLLEKSRLLRKLGRPAAAQQALQAAQRFGATAADLPQDSGTHAAEARPPHPASLQDKAGSGFFVNQAGDIVTNAHVVAGCGHIETSEKTPLRILGTDKDVDLAVLHADHAPAESAALRIAPAPRVGEDVLAFGFPLPGLLSSEGNVTVGILSATRGVGDDPHVFQMTAPVQSGNSGGPLIDASGNVVGVVVSKLDAATMSRRTGDVPQNVNFAVKSGEVTVFLDRYHVAYRLGQPGERKNAADLAEMAKKFAVQIICFGG
jgi:S1-C subfamily serine protease